MSTITDVFAREIIDSRGILRSNATLFWIRE